MLTCVRVHVRPTEDPSTDVEQTGFAYVNPWGVNGVESHPEIEATWVRMDDGYTYMVAETAEEVVELVNTELDK